VKLRLLIAGIALLAVLLFPSFDRLRAHQSLLWTSAHNPGGDWQYTNGVAVADICEWQRVRLGLPLRAVTLDRQRESGARQLRIEWRALVANAAVFTSAYGFVLVLRSLWRQNKTHPHPDTF
jgi:hypothetical protein